MGCTKCEDSSFRSNTSIVVSIQTSGSTASLFVQNQGRNAVEIRRILLCYESDSRTTTLFLRAAGAGITWLYSSTYLEQGLLARFYELNELPPGTIIQAQAEYDEFDGRSRSCSQTL